MIFFASESSSISIIHDRNRIYLSSYNLNNEKSHCLKQQWHPYVLTYSCFRGTICMEKGTDYTNKWPYKKSKELAKFIHHCLLMLHHRMNITIQRDRRIFVSEHLRQRFYIHAAFDCAGSKCMTKNVVVHRWQIILPQYPAKVPLHSSGLHHVRFATC